MTTSEIHAGEAGVEGGPPGGAAATGRLVRVGVLSESGTGERRVALVPEVLAKVSGLGVEVLIERGAGAAAVFADDQYASAGAAVIGRDEVLAQADVLLTVGPLDAQTVATLRRGQVVIGLLRPWESLDAARTLGANGVSAIALDYLPRTLSRAQVMDALTSQASIAGYRAALHAANAYGGYFPMLMTAAGTVKPAEVLVLGAGVAGLQAIATARRLGASVSGYDVRPAARSEVASLGAKFVDLPGVVSTVSNDGYARELTEEERTAQQAALDKYVARSDVIITTAQVPGRKPPLLVRAAALEAMRPGSVVLDMAASSYGGNVEGSVPEQTVTVGKGVTLIGAGSLASDMAPAASRAYARNLTAVLAAVVKDGALAIDPADEAIGAMLVTHDGAVLHPAIRDALAGSEGEAR